MSKRHKEAMNRYGLNDKHDTVNLGPVNGWFMYEICPIDWNYGAVDHAYWLDEGGDKEIEARTAYFTKASIALWNSRFGVGRLDFLQYDNRVFYLPNPEDMSMSPAFLFGWHSGLRHIVSPVRMLFEDVFTVESAWHPAMEWGMSNADRVEWLLAMRHPSLARPAISRRSK